MKKIIVLCFIILVATFGLGIAQGAWHPEKTYWPRTVIDSSDSAIDAVRERVQIEPYSAMYETILTTSETAYSSCSKERDKARVARCAAFRYLIENNGTTTYADKAKEYLLVTQRDEYSSTEEHYKNILWDSETISMVCIAYDFLKGMGYDFGDDETAIRNQISELASSLYYDLVENDSYTNPLWLMWVNGQGEQINYGVKFASAMGMTAIVLNTETNPDSWKQPQTWINYSMTTLNKQFNQMPSDDGGWIVDDDGGWAEGPHYQGFAGGNFLPFAISHYNFVNGQTESYGGESLQPLLLTQNFYANSIWGIRIRMPNGARPNFDDSFLNPYYFNGMLAGYLDDDLLAWDYKNADEPYFVSNSSDNIDVEVVCASNQSYAGNTPPAFSPTQFLIDAGQAVFRSSWDNDAVYMCLLGEFGIAREGGHTHEHPDNTSFVIFAYGELLAMDSGYVSWDKRDFVRYAKNHSLILVDGEGPPAASSIYANGTDAFITNNFDTDRFDYSEILTEYQDTYFQRSVSFINNSYFIISDFVTSNNSHTYSWLLHGNGGGTTGNDFTETPLGSTYSVGDVDLNFFINSTQDITLSNYDDYHDGGVYDSLFTHTVTCADVIASETLYSSFIIPENTTADISYTPINLGSCIGGTISSDNEKTITLVKYDHSIVTQAFFESEVSYDGHQLIVSKDDNEIPKNIFMTEGQEFVYDGNTIISNSVFANIVLNIDEDFAAGYVDTSCTVGFFTGNEPSSVTGGSYTYSGGITSVTFPEATNFEINVIWSFEQSVDQPPYKNDIENLSIYPNPFSGTNNISFTLSKSQKISIEVFNLKGQKISTIQNSILPAGEYIITWHGLDKVGNKVANGTYFYKIHLKNGKTINKKINLLR
ncbi:MAG: heparinase II/III family protein [Candidatus Cloacimonadota bacterium]|nr:heparinase II/III family protein [Candidatus Cloacimonadota bacterium]